MFAKRSVAAEAGAPVPAPAPVAAVPAAAEQPQPAPIVDLAARVHVSRQPVLDTYERVTGYRVAYAALEQTAPEQNAMHEQLGETTASDALNLFDTVLSVIGLERLV